jgi:FKBP-type peptidyl-prolyl cis-trans isomerase
MRKILMLVLLAAIGLTSCNQYKKGDGATLYKLNIDKDGPKITEGDFIYINVVIKNDADSIVSSTYETGNPEPMILPAKKFAGDIFATMKLLTEGDSITVKLPADSIFKQASSRPPMFKKSKYLVYNIKVEKLISKGKLTDQQFQSAIQKFIAGQVVILKNKEQLKIKNYISDKKMNAAKTDSGIYYNISKKGTGPLAINGDTVVVNYTGSQVSGKIFDSNVYADAVKGKIVDPSRQYAPMGIPAGEPKVVRGLNLCLLLLNKGAVGDFIIPSALAYGERGNGVIMPFSPLVFHIEVVNIIHPDPASAKPAKK